MRFVEWRSALVAGWSGMSRILFGAVNEQAYAVLCVQGAGQPYDALAIENRSGKSGELMEVEAVNRWTVYAGKKSGM